MTALVIHAPRTKIGEEGKKSFDRTLGDSMGEGYVIPNRDYARLQAGCRVVVLDKDAKMRAEGWLVKLVPRAKTPTGLQRYDVYFENAQLVPYQPEALRRWGTAVLED